MLDTERDQLRGSATQRGYDAEHRALRRLIISLQPYCSFCGATEQLEADHIVPLAQGGTTTQENLQVLCKPCNTRKGAQ